MIKHLKISKDFKYKVIYTWFKYGGAITPRLVAKIAYEGFFTRPSRFKPGARDLKLISNAKILEQIFENKKMRGYEWGNGKTTVLLAHGWSNHALTMRSYISSLVDKGYRVIAFDAPAHGNSEGIHSNGLQYTNFLNILLNKYHPKIVIGHSLGGICLLTALANINRPSIDKVIVLSSPISTQSIVKQFLIKANLHKYAHRHFYQYLDNTLSGRTGQFDLRQIYNSGINYSGIIVHDKDDKVIPYIEAQELAKIWPQAQFITTVGLGHSRILRDDEILDQIVNYI